MRATFLAYTRHSQIKQISQVTCISDTAGLHLESIRANPGPPAGMTVQQLLTALAVSTPDGQTLWSYDALGDAATGSATGLALLKSNIQVANLVTSGANMLTNDSSLYASFAIIMNQALAKKVSILTSKGACLGQVSPLLLIR